MKYLYILISVLIASCSNNNSKLVIAEKTNDSIKNSFAPDKRVALYNIEVEQGKNGLLISGETNLPKAAEALKAELHRQNLSFADSIKILPDATLEGFTFAVVNNSVANIRSEAKHSAELATQALLGTPLKVLKRQGSFYLVQTPDDYLSWVDHGGIRLMDEKLFFEWNAASKIIYTKHEGYVYTDFNQNNKVSDIVMGSVLNYNSETEEGYHVVYPDGRKGFVLKAEAKLFRNWFDSVEPSGELIESYAKDFMGAPYLWGGTSSKGVDCSGFTKTVYLMNGFIIPRDASQQIMAGLDVDPGLDFKNLKKGDLMFFGSKATADKKQRVTHVGIWLGNNDGQFIHSASQVRLSSVNPESEHYDKANTDRYLGSRRYLHQNDSNIRSVKDIFNQEKVLQ
ncbi:C40 family peptidase [Namhaeicola litoreus]|uniref:NlpC/P60 family protein n=1 Tax=Namhaeicola litoreus TaxID=1052145 RepID=A0ABW3Y6K1_9FLAO